jgi:hypothetical protein
MWPALTLSLRLPCEQRPRGACLEFASREKPMPNQTVRNPILGVEQVALRLWRALVGKRRLGKRVRRGA